MGRVFKAGFECGRCQGGKYQCSSQLADAGLGDLNERAISSEEVGKAVNEMISGKAPGLDGFSVECLKKGGMVVLEWLVRLLNLSFDMGVVPMDGRGACIVPLYKGKGDKSECSNSRGIALLSVVSSDAKKKLFFLIIFFLNIF